MAQTPQAKYRKDYQSPSHTITDIDLTFELSESKTIVTAKSQLTQLENQTSLKLDGDGLTLKQVTVNGEKWSNYKLLEDGLQIDCLPKQCELVITTEVNPEENSALEGLYLSDGAFCTQCEAEGFRRITYFLDRPDVLAKYTTKIIADKTKYPSLLSNGNRIAQGELEDNKHWVEWQDPHPKPSYLFALVAGDFDILSDSYITRSGRDVQLEIYVDKGNLDRANHAMLSLKNAMKWDEQRFDLEYDLDIYMIVAVDFFNMGAMENKGLNVFNSKFVLANEQTATDTDYLGIEAVIGHEYFHNWTGNRVTCRDWFQLSLKEGLTVFRDQEFSSDLGSRSVNRINNVRIIRGPQFAEDASPMSHPIRPDKVIEMNNFYTLTVYEKGSEVIRMIHTLLGEDNFQKGMKLYFERHDGTAATCEDFVSAMEDASGISLKHFRLWYSQSGTPTVKVIGRYDVTNFTYTLEVEQHTEPTKDQKEKQALHIPLAIELYNQDGTIAPLVMKGETVSNVLNLTENRQVFTFEGIEQEPVPSLLLDFSAPVKLEYDYTDEELGFLIVHANNDFSRWDAGQMLLAKHIKANIERVQSGGDVSVPASITNALKDVLINEEIDPALVAEMMTLPSFNEISGWYDQVDVDSIDIVIKSFKKTLANLLQNQLESVYLKLDQKDYSLKQEAIGKRALRNCCLSYLAHTSIGLTLVEQQYRDANNMTDTMAAMHAANSAQLECREQLMSDYSQKWKHDGLVMDKWFQLQGSNPVKEALSTIKETMAHEAFSMKNPNRVRSLIGSFMNMNPTNFHSKSGEGYKFAGAILRELNDSNPQVASRLLDPFLKLKKYDNERQDLIKQELLALKNMNNLAKDLYEKVTKALDE